MNRTIKKIIHFILFSCFILFLFSPKLAFAECTYGCKYDFEEEKCKSLGYWICGCKGIYTDSIFEINTKICYSQKEIKTCQSDGTWSIETCPNGCESGSTGCNPPPTKECSQLNATKCSDTGREACICKAYQWKCSNCPYGCLSGSCKNSPKASSSGGSDPTSKEINLSAPFGFESLGKLTLGNAVPSLINIIYIISSLTFFFILLSGGIKWLTSSGDEKKLAAARAQISSGFVGLAIVFSTWAIMTLIGTLFGFDPFKLDITPFTNSSGGSNLPPIIKQPPPTRIVPQYTQ